MFCLGQVHDGRPPSACEPQKDVGDIFNFPVWMACSSISQQSLADWAWFSCGDKRLQLNCRKHVVLEGAKSSSQKNCPELQLLGNFLENQDVPRFPSCNSDQRRITSISPDSGYFIIFTIQDIRLAVPEPLQSLRDCSKNNTLKWQRSKRHDLLSHARHTIDTEAQLQVLAQLLSTWNTFGHSMVRRETRDPNANREFE